MHDGDEDVSWASPGAVAPASTRDLRSGTMPAPASSWPAPPGAVPPVPGHGAAPSFHGAPPPRVTPTSASWQPGFMPLRPLGFGDLLGLPFRAMRANRAVVVGGPLLLTLLATALLAVGLWMMFDNASLVFLDPTVDSPFGESVDGLAVGVVIVAVIALLLADVLSSAIVAPGVARGVLGERIRLSDAWRSVRPRTGSLLLLYVLAGLALAAVITVGVLVIVFAASNDSTGGVIAAVIVLLLATAVASFLVMLVGGIARPVIVLEQRGAIAAIRRTVGLLKGRFWWSVLVLFVAAVLVWIVSGIVSNVGSTLATVLTFLTPESTIIAGIGFIVVMVLSLVISYVLTYSYLGSLFALLLIDLRIRHEGFDLTLAEAAEARRA